MALEQSVEQCMASAIGERGLEDKELAALLSRTEPALDWLRAAREGGTLPLLALPERDDDLAEVREAAEWLKRDATDVVCLGTGGSSLGGQTLAQLAGWRLPVIGDFPPGPQLHFLDNLDPETFDALLDRLPLATTRVFVVSKSGGTGETLLQALAFVAAFRSAGLGERVGDAFLGLSEPAKAARGNKLRDLLEPMGVRFLAHDTGIGGRFSALSNVGLVPAAIAGVDVAAVRAGAARALAPVLAGAPAEQCPAALGAAVAVGMAETRGISTNVTLAYADRLERFTRWWVQLWSESLGKRGHGMTAVPALGPVDQHSALQLFLDGPADKLFTVVMTDCAGRGPRIEATLAQTAGQPDFGGRTIGDFVASQQRATADTLAGNGRPVRTLQVSALDESHLGELLMHFMLETIVAAHLLGVDAFDQPAVEQGKVLAREYLAQL